MNANFNNPSDTITAASSDDELQAAISRSEIVVQLAQQEATRMHQTARHNVPSTAVSLIDEIFEDARRRTFQTTRRDYMNHRSKEWFANRIALLRISLEAIEKLTPYQSKVSEAVAADMFRQVEQARIRADVLALAVAQPQPFNVTGFLAGLIARGVQIGTSEGAVTATPAGRLTEADRATVRAHKAAIVAALSAAEVVA